MLKILDKSDCCGCEVCFNVCPKKCIEMVQDDWGFYYPKIDENQCVNCGMCDSVCPFLKQPTCTSNIAYVAQSKDKAILMSSAAGGVYTTISKHILENGGISVGVSYKNRMIMHTIVDDVNEVTTHSSSKYVQSRLFNIYNDIRDLLNSHRKVLFSGTPCQVNALKNYLDKDYENLYSIDLVCSGVTSPKVFDEYIKYMERYSSGIKDINFKYKKYGYHSSTMQIKYSDGRIYSRSRLTDYMSNIYTSYIAMRPSCNKCKAKGNNRGSDLTIFDAWHYNKLTGKEDNGLGYTNIIVNTKKGNSLIEMCKDDFELSQIDSEMAIELDGNVYAKSVSANVNTTDFFRSFNTCGLVETVKIYSDISFFSYIKEIVKPLLYKMGLLDVVKRKFSKSRC